MVEAKASAGSTHWTSDEMMTVAAARELTNGLVCFVGIGLPSTAANLARATHAPDAVLIYESGCIGCKPERLPLSIGDGELSRSADVVVSIPELFTYWLQAGRIDVGFLGAAQIDRFGNINSTVIGDYRHPTVRLPGAGGAPEIASSCSKVIVTLRHSPRAMVEKMDFISSVGHGEGLHFRQKLNRPGVGPQAIITDLGVLRYDAETAEFVLVSAHPGVEVSSIVSATGWPLRQAPHVEITRPPSEVELAALRNLTRVDGESI
jgi:glutaconate CoA-transferase subunit B